MSLKIAVQMDPIHAIDVEGDSTFALMEAAQGRGHTLHYYMPHHLSFEDGRVTAFAHPVKVQRNTGNHAEVGVGETVDLSTFDVILMRQDPPFDMAYITATHILEHIHPKTLVVNDPFHVRNAPEKLFATHFDGLLPPTLITSHEEEIRRFRAEHKDIILKPLYGNGGAGVFRVKPDDENLNSLIEMFSEHYREPIIAQAYLKDVRQGDKRIILVDGEPVGAINRIPAEGEARSNMHVGGKAVHSTLTPREEEICAAIGPELKARGLIFTGIDVIGDFLTEINVTSPTGIQEIKRFGGADIAELIWDAVEAKR